ncbi:hypothetical protein [Streptomyces mayteni]
MRAAVEQGVDFIDTADPDVPLAEQIGAFAELPNSPSRTRTSLA